MLNVVILDDQEVTVRLLAKFINSITEFPDLNVYTFTDEREAISWLLKNQADLILIDYKLNTMSGTDVISVIRLYPRHHSVPIIVVTEFDQKQVLYEALDAGANDFLAKPIDAIEYAKRCTNMLRLRTHQLALEHHNLALSRQVEASLKDTLIRLARAGEFRDSETGNHILRMAHYSRLIAEQLGLDTEICELVELASPMHDIGKIGIPDHILLKQGPLNDHEWDVMKRHTNIGHEILSGSDSKYLQMGASIALYHHEKYDGSGYPAGLSGDAIPIEARIVAVADVFDALTTRRPYKKNWNIEDAVQFLKGNSGTQFDPKCVNAFVSQLHNVKRVLKELEDKDNVVVMSATTRGPK
ncbi:MAG: response regulator [Gammaproteobacteria bacterium]|nr:response regulator [Gammaproteobacteria bacterium]